MEQFEEKVKRTAKRLLAVDSVEPVKIFRHKLQNHYLFFGVGELQGQKMLAPWLIVIDAAKAEVVQARRQNIAPDRLHELVGLEKEWISPEWRLAAPA